MRWCDGAAVAALLSLALLGAGCTAGGGGPSAASSEPSASSTLSDKMSSFFSGATAKSPQAVAGAQPDINCPPVEIRQGASTLTVGPTGDNATMSLKYQGNFLRAARDCSVAAGNMVMKVGVQGRIIVGPAGGPGQLEVPLRIAVVEEVPGGFKPIVTKLIRIPVTIGPGLGNALFSHVEEGISFPLPTPTTKLDDYIVYVGFDPLAAAAQDQNARPKPKARTRAN